MRSSANPPPRDLPTLSAVAPAWAAATAKLLDLQRQEEELLGEIQAGARDWMHATMSSPPVALEGRQRRYRPERDMLSPAAKASLGPEFTPQPPQPLRPVDPAREAVFSTGDPHEQHVADLTLRLNGIRQAIEVVQVRLQREHVAGSRILCDAVRSDYAQRAAAVCAALVALAAAFEAHESFCAEIVAGGGSPLFLPPIGLEFTGLREFVGNPRSANGSALRSVIEGATAAGFYDARAAVAEWSAPAKSLPLPPFADAVAALREAMAARENAPSVAREKIRQKKRMLRAERAERIAAESAASLVPGRG
jgi:hypothetical protein